MRLSLTHKIIALTCLVLLAAMACYAYLNIQALQEILLHDTIHSAERLSETLIRSTNHQMMRNDLAEVNQIMHASSKQQEVEGIRLINEKGRIVFSSNSREIGTVLQKGSEICITCHSGAKPLLKASYVDRSRIFRDEAGKRVLGLAKAIYNEEDCSSAQCHVHPPETKVLGVLDVVVSLEGMENQLARSRTWVIILTMVLLLASSFILSLFTQRLVNRPINQLLEHTGMVTGGDLERSIRINSNDELGELARSFNSMTASLKSALDQLAQWNRTLEEKVTERTGEIRKMQAQLARSEKLSSLGQMSAGIAHEINNPMTGILLYANLVLDDARLSPFLQDDLRVIISETERCAVIVKQLLDFSRESKPEKQWGSLNDIIGKALALLEHQSLFQNIKILSDLNESMPHIYVDHWQMEQVFINIILNAGQAIVEAGTINISTGLTQDNSYIYAKIADNGCGIESGNLNRIFDPFFTTKEDGGTGLGLSVSYGIINNHGGEIEATSEVGTGTTITIRLPLFLDA